MVKTLLFPVVVSIGRQCRGQCPIITLRKLSRRAQKTNVLSVRNQLTETDRQTDIQTDRQTDRQTDTYLVKRNS